MPSPYREAARTLLACQHVLGLFLPQDGRLRDRILQQRLSVSKIEVCGLSGVVAVLRRPAVEATHLVCGAGGTHGRTRHVHELEGGGIVFHRLLILLECEGAFGKLEGLVDLRCGRGRCSCRGFCRDNAGSRLEVLAVTAMNKIFQTRDFRTYEDIVC